VTAIVLLLGLLTLGCKVWGVVLMGASVMIFFFMPWLDRSPVRSIRYKGPITKTALTLFVIVFFALGYLGTESVTEGRTLARKSAQRCISCSSPDAVVFEDGQKPARAERVTWK